MTNNQQLISDLYLFFGERDLEALRGIFHPEIRWEQMDGFPGGGTYIGPDAIFDNVFSSFKTDWTGWKANVTELVDAGDDVFAIGHYLGTYNSTGLSMRSDFAHRYSIQTGVVVAFKQYADTLPIADVMRGS